MLTRDVIQVKTIDAQNLESGIGYVKLSQFSGNSVEEMRRVLVPLIEGLHAFAQGDYRTSIARIEPLRPRIVELGGSRAQRDVFHDTLFEACFRAGDAERAGRYLAERLAYRRDHPWLSRVL